MTAYVFTSGGFPASPVAGDTLAINSAQYDWNGTTWQARAAAGNFSTLTTNSETAPTSPLVGDRWFNTTTGVLVQYFSDGTDSAWLDIAKVSGSSGADGGSSSSSTADFVASGAIASGAGVIINTNGTVSIPTATATYDYASGTDLISGNSGSIIDTAAGTFTVGSNNDQATLDYALTSGKMYFEVIYQSGAEDIQIHAIANVDFPMPTSTTRWDNGVWMQAGYPLSAPKSQHFGVTIDLTTRKMAMVEVGTSTIITDGAGYIPSQIVNGSVDVPSGDIYLHFGRYHLGNSTLGYYKLEFNPTTVPSGYTKLGTATVGTSLTTSNFIGSAEAAYADGESASIMLQGGISAKQTGLSVGTEYYLQGDGSLNTTAGSPLVKFGKALTATSVLLKAY